MLNKKCLKVVLFGPESSGKTTLAKLLAKHYRTNYVPEFARDYLQKKWDRENKVCSLKDLPTIVEGQKALERKILKKSKNIIFCDTNVVVTQIWSQTHFNGFCFPKILNAARESKYDYYLLTERISELKGNGVDTVKWEVTRYIKVSFAFTNLIVILCGIPLVVLKEKNSLSFGAGSSVFVIFGYYAFIKFGQSLGFKGVITPLLSAWIGNLVFMVAGILLFWRAKT